VVCLDLEGSGKLKVESAKGLVINHTVAYKQQVVASQMPFLFFSAQIANLPEPLDSQLRGSSKCISG